MPFMPPSASIIKRLAACLYEFVLLIAIWLVCVLVFILLFGNAESSGKRQVLQLVLWLVAGAYFIWCWHRSGQTLAAQTWKIKLVNEQNNLLTINQSIQRYCLASASVLALGVGLLWALVDKEQLFLHDRILKTRLINASLT